MGRVSLTFNANSVSRVSYKPPPGRRRRAGWGGRRRSREGTEIFGVKSLAAAEELMSKLLLQL